MGRRKRREQSPRSVLPEGRPTGPAGGPSAGAPRAAGGHDEGVPGSAVLLGRRGAGKTTLLERLLHVAGALRRPGNVDDGTTLLDFDPESRRLRRTTGAWAAWVPREGRILHLVDTPGAEEGRGVTRHARWGADLDVILAAADGQLDEVALQHLREARRAGRPAVVVLTHLDRADGLCDAVLADLEGQIRGVVDREPVVLQRPFRDAEGELAGLVDLVSDRVRRFDPDGSGAFSPEPVPSHLGDAVRSAREQLMERAALADDRLVERYLEDLGLSEPDVWRGLAAGARAGALIPVLLACGPRGLGAERLLDVLARVAPEPSPDRVAGPRVLQWIASRLDEEGQPVALLRVWSGTVVGACPLRHPASGGTGGAHLRLGKVYGVRGPRRARPRAVGAGALLATWDPLPGRCGDVFCDPGLDEDVAAELAAQPPPWPAMVWRSLRPTDRSSHDRLPDALRRLAALDPTWRATASGNARLGEQRWTVSGHHAAQLDRLVARLHDDEGITVEIGEPPVLLRERLRREALGVDALYERVRDGLVCAHGHVVLDVRPAPELGQDPVDSVRFDWRPDPEDLPHRWREAVERGVRAGLRRGPRTGRPVLGVSVTCTGGSYDILESTDEHFEAAAEQAIAEALVAGGTDVLEPWWVVRAVAHDEDVGAVLDVLSSGRGRVTGLEVDPEGATSIWARMPETDVRRLSAALGSAVGARSWFEGRPDGFEARPEAHAGRLVAASADDRGDPGGAAGASAGYDAAVDGAPRRPAVAGARG